jgi:hypothetical protein
MAMSEGLEGLEEAKKQAIEEASEKLEKTQTIPSADYGKVLQRQKRIEEIRKARGLD